VVRCGGAGLSKAISTLVVDVDGGRNAGFPDQHVDASYESYL